MPGLESGRRIYSIAADRQGERGTVRLCLSSIESGGTSPIYIESAEALSGLGKGLSLPP